MEPVTATAEQIAMWAAHDGAEPQPVTIGGPEEGADVTPCPTLIAQLPAGGLAIHVAYEPSAEDLANLAQGGCLWLTCYGPLPVHMLSVEHRVCSCGDTGWVIDQNYQPEDYAMNDPRRPGAGLIPCGLCNLGGWDHPAPDEPSPDL